MRMRSHRLKRLGGLIRAGLCACLLLWGAAAADGQERGGKRRANDGKPLRVTSDKMEVRSRENLIVFLGDVKANRGDLRIQADRLEV